MEQERRSSGGQRVPFEALVVVANQKGGAGAYECEAVDLSENGMHLRTAYLPEQGQVLTFRFDTGSGEVALDGEVVWREEQARGGEFGVRFTRLDEATMITIREALGLPADGSGDAEAAAAAAPTHARAGRGSKVRLHIDGLSSPMRARVRDDHTGEVLVGSNLDFLKVGKNLELEDVEHGKRRGAFVDKVEVEVDPASKVPQLVVTLRYEEGGKAAEVAKKAAGVKATSTADSKGSRADEARREARSEPKKGEPTESAEGAEGDEAEGAHGATAGAQVKETIAQAGAKLSALSATARSAVGTLIERIRARREEEKEQEEAEAAPRRVTAPPPDGGVRTSGSRRASSETEDTVENNEEISGIEETDEETLKTRKKQRTMIAAGASLLAVLLVVFGVRAKSSAPPPGAEAAATEAAAVATIAALPAARGIGSAEAISANVPLFGNTPLSGTEPAPLPSPTVAQNPAQIPGGAVAVQAGGDDDDDKGEGGKTEFGKGDVKKPRTVRIKMDAPITDLRGSTSGETVTVFLPGRRNVEPAATLAKRDKRLSAVKAVPKDGGVEVSFAFKDEVPPFLAKANGKMLEFDMGEAAKDDGDDDSDGKSAAKKSGKKKIAKGSKAADKKKATAKKGGKKAGKAAKKAKKHSDD